jgi:DNA-binding winged helix-turn-helix (wHTH) protein
VDDPFAAVGERAASFGPFQLRPKQRLLLEGDKPVRLGSRALDILIALVERAGEVVGKDELMARVWPDTFVDEGNLKFQIGVLRRGLGDGHAGNRYIATIPGRGYSLVSVVRLTEEALPAALHTASARRSHNLPASPTRLVGRAETVIRLADSLSPASPKRRSASNFAPP